MKRKYPISNPRYQNGELGKIERNRGSRHQEYSLTERRLLETIEHIDLEGLPSIESSNYASYPYFTFTNLREGRLPIYLRRQLNSEKITRVQYDTLISQLTSKDPEAWYLAFVMIKTIMKL